MPGANAAQRPDAFPHPAHADRPLGGGRVDDVPALGDLDLARGRRGAGRRRGPAPSARASPRRRRRAPPRSGRSWRRAARAASRSRTACSSAGRPRVVPRRRQASEHQRTSSQSRSHFLRQVIVRPQPAQGLVWRSPLGPGAVRAQRAGPGPAQPRPRVQGHDVEGGRAACASRAPGRRSWPAGGRRARCAGRRGGPRRRARRGSRRGTPAACPTAAAGRAAARRGRRRGAGRGGPATAGSRSPSDSAVSQTASGSPVTCGLGGPGVGRARRSARPAARPAGRAARPASPARGRPGAAGSARTARARASRPASG